MFTSFVVYMIIQVLCNCAVIVWGVLLKGS